MLEEDLAAVFEALNRRKVRYLVVGGLAVIAHGHARGTADLDLVVALEEANVLETIDGLSGLGYRPLAPVNPRDFAKAEERRSWAEQKGMRVFQMISDQHPATSVDLFVSEPFDFAAEYRLAPRIELVAGLQVPVVHYETLLQMKRDAGRPRDLDDVENLEAARRSHEAPDLEI